VLSVELGVSQAFLTCSYNVGCYMVVSEVLVFTRFVQKVSGLTTIHEADKAYGV